MSAPSPPSPLRHARSADQSRLQQAYASPLPLHAPPAISTSTAPQYTSFTPRSRLPAGFPYASSLWVAQLDQQAQQWPASRSFMPRLSKDSASEPRRASTSSMLSDSDAGDSGESGDVDLDLTVELPTVPVTAAAMNKPSFTSIPILPSLTAYDPHPSSSVSGRQSPSSPSERPYDQQRHRLESNILNFVSDQAPPLGERTRTRRHSAQSAISLPPDSQGWCYNVTPSLLSMNGARASLSERSNTPDLLNQSAGDSSGSSFGQDHRFPPLQTTTVPRMPVTIRERRKKTSPSSASMHRRLSSSNSLRILPPSLVKAFGTSGFPSPSRHRAAHSQTAPSPLQQLNMSPSTTTDGLHSPSTPGMTWSPRTTVSQGTTVATSPIEPIDHDDNVDKLNHGGVPTSASFGLGLLPLDDEASHDEFSNTEPRLWGWKSITSSLFGATKPTRVKEDLEDDASPRTSKAGTFPTPHSAFQHILSGRSSYETHIPGSEASRATIPAVDDEAVEELQSVQKHDGQSQMDNISSGIPFLSVSSPEQVESEWNTAAPRDGRRGSLQSDHAGLRKSASHASDLSVNSHWQTCSRERRHGHDQSDRRTYPCHDHLTRQRLADDDIEHDGDGNGDDDILTVPPQESGFACSSRFSDSSTSVLNQQHSRTRTTRATGAMIRRLSLIASSSNAFMENQRKRKESLIGWSRRASTLFNSRTTAQEQEESGGTNGGGKNVGVASSHGDETCRNEVRFDSSITSTPTPRPNNHNPASPPPTTTMTTTPATPAASVPSPSYDIMSFIDQCVDYVDETVPSKLCFEMGFILGPWCWVIGGWWLRSSDGEIHLPFSITTTATTCHFSEEPEEEDESEESVAKPEGEGGMASPTRQGKQQRRRIGSGGRRTIRGPIPYCRKNDACVGQIWVKRNRQAASLSGGIIFVVTIVVLVLAVK